MSKALLTIITIIKESLKSSYGWYISLLIYSLILWILALIIEPIVRFYIRKHKSGNLYLNNETKCKLQDIQDLRKIHEKKVKERQRIPTNFRLYEYIRSAFK